MSEFSRLTSKQEKINPSVKYLGATHASTLLGKKMSFSDNDHKRTYPRGPAFGSLGAFISSFKSAASKRIRQVVGNETCQIWHRNYYEPIIRDEESLQRIADGIYANPENWADDLIHFP